MEQLQALAGCGRPWAESRAQMALEIRAQFDAGHINASEFQELMMDLIRSDKLDAEADDLNMKSALVSAVMVASSLA